MRLLFKLNHVAVFLRPTANSGTTPHLVHARVQFGPTIRVCEQLRYALGLSFDLRPRFGGLFFWHRTVFPFATETGFAYRKTRSHLTAVLAGVWHCAKRRGTTAP